MAGTRARPGTDWRCIRLANIGSCFRSPRIFNDRDRFPRYPRENRQIAVVNLGHVDPVLLLTNQLQARPADLVNCLAREMVVENPIAETIDVVHMAALSAASTLRLDTEIRRTLMARCLCQILANRVGNG